MSLQREESEGSEASFSVDDVVLSLLRQITTETKTEGHLHLLPHPEGPKTPLSRRAGRGQEATAPQPLSLSDWPPFQFPLSHPFDTTLSQARFSDAHPARTFRTPHSL